MRTTPLVRIPVKRVDQSGQEASFAFPCRGAVTALPALQPGIEQVPEGLAEHVEGVDHNRQEKPRPERRGRNPALPIHTALSGPNRDKSGR